MSGEAPSVRSVRWRSILLGGGVVLLVGLIATALFFRNDGGPPTVAAEEEKQVASQGPIAAVTATVTTTATSVDPLAGTKPWPGENILRGYGDPATPPEHDLLLMSRLMDTFLLLVKSASERPLSANEDWASAFRGVNPTQERFLPDQHVALDSAGRLVDRWDTPLFFHALGGGRFEIRSAGPDRALWTADDLHRNADGTYRKGINLVGGELLDIAGDRERR